MKIEATLRGAGKEIPNVVCTISLPLVHEGKVPIECHFDANDVRPLGLGFEFELYATIKDHSGEKREEIDARRVYFVKHTAEYIAPGKGDAVLHAEAIDFRVTHFFPGERDLESGELITFWLTPSILLRSSGFIEKRFDTGAKYHSSRVRCYDLPGMAATKFESHLVYHDDPDRVFSASDHLVAVVSFPQESAVGRQLESLERFLTLTSFAERQRCVCYRYSVRKSGESSDHYRGDITIPKIENDHTYNDTLIDVANFDEFVRIAFPRALSSTYKQYLFDAMMKLTHSSSRTLESEYISCFAALENLLNAYRDLQKDSGILPADDWKIFEGNLKDFVREQPQFKDEKSRRILLYEKMGELNRPSLGAVLSAFVREVGVDLSGLWPVAEKQAEGVSLYQIRNQIVHGRLLPHGGFDPLIAAKEHLHWVLERCILALLGWDVTRSRANDATLRRSTMKDWAHESHALWLVWRDA